MKKTLFIICGIFTLIISCNNEKNDLNNLKAFAKAYGYVKYFHPSDEASEIDWTRFAAYGAEEILKCKNQTEVVNVLNTIFKPIAPTVKFSKKIQSYNLDVIKPKNISDYKITYWQHKGLSRDMNSQNSIYKSVRINRDQEVDEASSFGNLFTTIIPEQCKGKKIKYTGWVKLQENSTGTGHLWLRVDKVDDKLGFFDNMVDNPIRSNSWQKYEIIGNVDVNASRINLGCFLKGEGTLFLDDVHLYFKEKNNWIEIPIKNNNFETNEIGEQIEDSNWTSRGKGYSYGVSEVEKKNGKYSATISHEGLLSKINGSMIFDIHPKFGEVIEKQISEGVYCQIPLSLYCNMTNTFPKVKSGTLKQLKETLTKIDESPTNLIVRLGNVINVYNVFQHFYPYFNEVEVDWEIEFEKALAQSFEDKTPENHLTTLQQFTSPLKDGHLKVWGPGDPGAYVPPIRWEWIENKLVITEVRTNKIKVGDVITKINNISPEEYFKDLELRISAGTKGWLNYTAQGLSLKGKKHSELIIEVNNNPFKLKRNEFYSTSDTTIAIQNYDFKFLSGDLAYLNLTKISMNKIERLMPQLESAKGVICDLRGYPNNNHDFISYLLKKDDTSKTWMRIPKIIYPNHEGLISYENHGWELKVKKSNLRNNKIVFITDGRAISYTESYLGFIKGYNLATIVGQPTAGTNGNVNMFKLLGKYGVSWTGMKVVKINGSQLHSIGILPDVYVNKTIEGVRLGRDELLDRAIEIISK